MINMSNRDRNAVIVVAGPAVVSGVSFCALGPFGPGAF